jgi:Flp pilus assembly protein TadB
MRTALSFRIRRRRAAFSHQLPDALQLIASALQSGFSLPQALDAVVREGAQPCAGELSRAIAEARIGGDLEDCLDMVANRMDSGDLRWTALAIRIQRSVGGNLAEILTTIAGTIRERAFLRRQVHALSAEGRLSSYILIALPVLVGAWLFLTSPQYMRPLYTTGLGEFMLAAAVVLLVVGTLWMRHQIKLEV